MAYFEHEDILHLAVAEDPEARSVELTPGIKAELDEKGELIGIGILAASTFLRDSIIELVQAKLLGVDDAPSERPSRFA